MVEKIEKSRCSELVDRAKTITEKAYKDAINFEFPLPSISKDEFKLVLKDKLNKQIFSTIKY